MENNKIESYISELNNLSELQKKERILEIDKYLDTLDLYKLMNVIFEYSNVDYIKENDLSSLFELFKDKVISKLDDLSLIKIIDLYIQLFNKTIIVSDILMASKNLLDIMSYNISDDSYIEKELEKKKISREEYLNILKKELDNNVKTIDAYTKTYDFLDNLQDKFLIYIEVSLDKIEKQEKEYLIQNINKRFSVASTKLLKLKDNLNNIKGFEYNDLKNSIIIYESFRNSLLDNKNDNQQ